MRPECLRAEIYKAPQSNPRTAPIFVCAEVEGRHDFVIDREIPCSYRVPSPKKPRARDFRKTYFVTTFAVATFSARS